MQPASFSTWQIFLQTICRNWLLWEGGLVKFCPQSVGLLSGQAGPGSLPHSSESPESAQPLCGPDSMSQVYLQLDTKHMSSLLVSPSEGQKRKKWRQENRKTDKEGGNTKTSGEYREGRKEKQTGFPGGSDDKASAYNAGDPGSIPGSGRSPGEGNGTPLQYSCLENPMDGGAWQATVYGVPKSRTRLRDFTALHFKGKNIPPVGFREVWNRSKCNQKKFL